MLRVALLDAFVGPGLRAITVTRLDVFGMGAVEKAARNTSCSGIGCAVLVRSDCVDVWPLSFGGLKRTQLYLLACSLVTRALDFPTDGTDYQNYTPPKWRCRSRKLLWLTRRRMRTRKDEKTKTYNRRDSQMVTHSSTSRPVQCLCMAERTGCPVLTDLWSYVLGTLQTCFQLIFRSQAVRLLVSTEWRGLGGGSVLLVPRSDRNLQYGIHTPERLRKGNRLKGHWSRNLNDFFMVALERRARLKKCILYNSLRFVSPTSPCCAKTRSTISLTGVLFCSTLSSVFFFIPRPAHLQSSILNTKTRKCDYTRVVCRSQHTIHLELFNHQKLHQHSSTKCHEIAKPSPRILLPQAV
jgi:hypothetical protein